MKPKLVWSAEVREYVISTGWSADGKYAAALCHDGRLYRWNAADGGGSIEVAAHQEGAFHLAWHPSEPVLATSGQDGKVRIWNTTDNTPVSEFEAGAAWVEELAWADSGVLAAAAGRKLTLWKSGKTLHQLNDHPSTIAGLAWRFDGRRIGAACYGGVKVWDPESGRLEETLPWKTSLISLAWSPDQRWVVAGTQENAVQIWELPFRPGEELAMSGYEAKVHELAWHHSGRYLATGGGVQIMVWDCGGEGPAGTEPRMLNGHLELVSALAYPRHGHGLASGGKDGLICFWNAGRSLEPLARHVMGNPVASLSWNRNGTSLLAGSENGKVLCLEVN